MGLSKSESESQSSQDESNDESASGAGDGFNAMLRDMPNKLNAQLAKRKWHQCCQWRHKKALSAGKLRSLGEQAMSERKFSDAASYYHQAINLEPTNYVNHYKLYCLHSRMRSLGDALTDLTEACALSPDKVEWGVQKAKLLVSLGRCEEATVEYGRVKQLTPPTKSPLAGEEESYQCAKLTQQAIQSYTSSQYSQASHLFPSALAYTTEAPDILFMKAQKAIGEFHEKT